MNRRTALAAGLAAAATGMAADAGAEKAVRAALDKYRNGMLNKDLKALEAVVHDKVMYSHSNARVETKAEFIQTIAEDNPRYQALDLAEQTIHVYGNSAVCRGNVTIKNTPKGGQLTTLQLNVLTVWAKEGGAWKLVARQSTRLQA